MVDAYGLFVASALFMPVTIALGTRLDTHVSAYGWELGIILPYTVLIITIKLKTKLLHIYIYSYQLITDTNLLFIAAFWHYIFRAQVKSLSHLLF